MDILEEGFLLVAGIGAHMRLHDVVDRLASKLFEHSTLLEDCSFQYRPPHRQLLRFAAHGKAHQAAQVHTSYPTSRCLGLTLCRSRLISFDALATAFEVPGERSS